MSPEQIIERRQNDPPFAKSCATALLRFHKSKATEFFKPWHPETMNESSCIGMKIEAAFWFVTIHDLKVIFKTTAQNVGRPELTLPSAFSNKKTQKGILCKPHHGDPPHLFQLVTFYNDGSSVFEKRLVGGKDEVRKQQGQEMFNSRVAIRQDTNPQEPQSDYKSRFDCLAKLLLLQIVCLQQAKTVASHERQRSWKATMFFI